MSNSSIELRSASEEEASDIRRLILQASINPLGLDWRRFIVAVDEAGELIGCGQLKPHGDEFLEMASLAVLKSRQGQGVGRRLIEALIDQSEPPLWLMCRSSLVPLYQKFGFKEVGPDEEQPTYFVRMRRAVRMFNTVLARDEYLAIMVRN